MKQEIDLNNVGFKSYDSYFDAAYSKEPFSRLQFRRHSGSGKIFFQDLTDVREIRNLLTECKNILRAFQRVIWMVWIWTKYVLKPSQNKKGCKFWLAAPKMFVFFKVHIFWEGHKILQNIHPRFDRYYIGQIEDFAKLCGLLRIYELYNLELNKNFSDHWKKNQLVYTEFLFQLVYNWILIPVWNECQNEYFK